MHLSLFNRLFSLCALLQLDRKLFCVIVSTNIAPLCYADLAVFTCFITCSVLSKQSIMTFSCYAVTDAPTTLGFCLTGQFYRSVPWWMLLLGC